MEIQGLIEQKVIRKKLSKSEIKLLIKRFFFPTYPFNVFRSTILMIILAVLLALNIILGSFAINIPGVGIALGFAYMPVMVVGWFFGPIIGTIFGAVSDTLGWAIRGGIWYWMYAIQEPMVGLIAGLIAGFVNLSIRFNKKLWIDILVQQFFVVGFVIIAIAMIFVYTSDDSALYLKLVKAKSISENFNTVIRYVIVGFMLVFLIVVEMITFIKFREHRSQNAFRKYVVFLYASINCVVNTVIFAFLLGPISWVNFFAYAYGHGRPPRALFEFGIAYYLLPRVITECFKTPVYIFLYSSLLFAVHPVMQRNINKLRNSWQAK